MCSEKKGLNQVCFVKFSGKIYFERSDFLWQINPTTQGFTHFHFSFISFDILIKKTELNPQKSLFLTAIEKKTFKVSITKLLRYLSSQKSDLKNFTNKLFCVYFDLISTLYQHLIHSLSV